MSKLGTKLNKLIENSIVMESKDSISSLTDLELCKQAEQMGLEELIVKDGEGNLTDDSRNELVQALNDVDNFKKDNEKINEDENKESSNETNYDGDFYVFDNGGAEANGTIDRYTIFLKSDFEKFKSGDLESLPFLFSGDDPKGMSGHDEFHDKHKQTAIDNIENEDDSLGTPIKFSELPEQVKNMALSNYKEELNSNQEKSTEDIDLEKDLVKESETGTRTVYTVRSGKNNKFIGTLFSDKPTETFGVKSLGKDVYFWENKDTPARLANGWQGKKMDAEVVAVKIENGNYTLANDLDESLKEADDEDKDEENTNDDLDSLETDDESEFGDEDKADTAEKEDSDSDEKETDSDEDTDETDDEVENVTVVVVSPELKKDDESDDELSSSYNLEKKDMKEHIDALHSGETLSEEFKNKSKVIFEAAINKEVSKIKLVLEKKYKTKESKLIKEYKEKLDVAQKQLIEEQAELVDGYLSEAIDTWVNENKLALEANIRTELTEEFIDRLKNLFSESYIEVPQEKFDLVKAQEEKINELQEALDRNKEKTLKYIKENKKLQCQSIIDQATADMTKIDKIKFVQLLESVDFSTVEEFEKKVKTLKESYSTKTPANKKIVTEKTKIINTDVKTIVEEKSTPVSAVLDLLNNSLNF